MNALQQQQSRRLATPSAAGAPAASCSTSRVFGALSRGGPCHQLRRVTCSVASAEETRSTVLELPQVSPQLLEEQRKAQEAQAIIKARQERRQREQLTYQVAAIAASAGVIALAVAATYFRFDWHMEESQDIPWVEIAATLTLVAGGAFGMEMWARWAHKALWHDYEPGWALHKSHHEPRVGPFEANDLFAIINGVPAMVLCAYGFLTPGIPGGVCFGAGLGITLFGISYMFIHDGLVHRRFPVGPLKDLPYMKKIAVAHQLHHAEKYGGAPWGMFLGPLELESIPGAKEELERRAAELDWSKR